MQDLFTQALCINSPWFIKDVKQDDFKALKFFQKACDLNDGRGCSNKALLRVLKTKKK
jgi:TPR repeat protein